MCRLLTSDLRGLNKLGKNKMKDFLDVLEKSCGGHSNGYLAIVDGIIVRYEKSCTLTNQDIVDDIYRLMPDWFIYHTRIASKGSIKDSNAHPYINEDKSFSLCMNGTMSDFGAISTKMDITDTDLLFRMMDKLDLPPDFLVDLTPRFMGIKNRRVFATNGSSSDLLEFDDDNCTIIASEFPLDYPHKTKTMKKSSCWWEGEEIKEEPVRAYNSYKGYLGYGGYSSSYDWYADYKAKQNLMKQVEEVVEKEEDEIFYEYDLLDWVDYGNELFRMGSKKSDVVKELKENIKHDLSKLKTTNGYYEIKISKKTVSLLNDTKEVIY